MLKITHPPTGRGFAHEELAWLIFHYRKFCRDNKFAVPSQRDIVALICAQDPSHCPQMPVTIQAPPKPLEWLSDADSDARLAICKACPNFLGYREGKTKAVDCAKCPSCTKAGGIKLALKLSRCPEARWK